MSSTPTIRGRFRWPNVPSRSGMSRRPKLISAALLRAGAAESRALGLVRLTAGQISARETHRLLVDSSVLVRIWARARWSEKGNDPEVTYRALTVGQNSPVIRARAFRGIVESGGTLERDVVLALVRDAEPALRKVGLELLPAVAVPDDAPLLGVLVESESSGVARRAVEVLATLPMRDVEGVTQRLLLSQSPAVRHRAWRLLRSVGDAWDRTLADLEMTFDEEESNAERARDVVRAPVFGHPSESQRERIERLLARTPEPYPGIAFAAGLR
ncbi:HEAT repeat domain-containing protein [Xylanimonas sp. McL0601]|uniref:HEAT repeat domain-containing protein n=1 Tax=Xylanimonas sp. McL0601 TaxID=3414739 RepID=UPI003CF175B5